MNYEANWESLKQHQPAKWFKDSKFGIFVHWGVYSDVYKRQQKDEAAGKSRTEGYKDAMKEYGLEVPEKMIITAGFNMDAGYESMKRLVNRCPELDAVFCATDTLAVGAVT